ncbi:DUF1707 domain-containing protein [Nocardia sp. NPDC006630]|uniref:DUF1707 SHOCT-like domain-containing protein n=1 Tax=Nocardia sp. NPDC006630 TaxID=3157181 RepID=UPI0033BE38C8
MSARSSDASGFASAGRMRARDVDRVDTRARLDAAYEEGQLGADEYDQRSQRAQAAQTIAELAQLVGDLQPGRNEAPPTATPAKPAELSRYPTRTRARDSDRAATALLLDAALADGQLNEADHRALIELAGEASTLGELADLTSDLQRPDNAPAVAQPPKMHRRKVFGWAVLAACAAMFAAGFVAVDQPPDIPAGAPVAPLGVVQPVVVPMPNLLTAEGFTTFRDLYRAKFGDVLTDDLTLYPGYAILTRSVPGQSNRQVRYDYRGGFAAGDNPTTRKLNTPVFDLGAVDPAALGRLISTALTTMNVDQGTISDIMFDMEDVSSARGGGSAPTVRVYVSNKANEAGYVEATPAGVITRSSPFRG